MDGEPLRNGSTYYILPDFRGVAAGGGIESAITGSETCPLTVVQSRSQFSNGLPIIISSPFRIDYINEGLPLDLSFTSVPPCAPTPSKWTIVKGKSERQWPVKLTGYFDTVQDVGIHIDSEGNRPLVLTQNDPLVVQFKTASSSAS